MKYNNDVLENISDILENITKIEPINRKNCHQSNNSKWIKLDSKVNYQM